MTDSNILLEIIFSNVKAFAPFPTVETRTDLIDKTYLDTTGRPTVLIKKFLCTDAHSGDIYVSPSLV